MNFKKCILLPTLLVSVVACTKDEPAEKAMNDTEILREKAEALGAEASRQAQEQIQKANVLAGQALDNAKQQVGEAGKVASETAQKAIDVTTQAMGQAASETQKALEATGHAVAGAAAEADVAVTQGLEDAGRAVNRQIDAAQGQLDATQPETVEPVATGQ